jgi:hypothetical protein
MISSISQTSFSASVLDDTGAGKTHFGTGLIVILPSHANFSAQASLCRLASQPNNTGSNSTDGPNFSASALIRGYQCFEGNTPALAPPVGYIAHFVSHIQNGHWVFFELDLWAKYVEGSADLLATVFIES